MAPTPFGAILAGCAALVIAGTTGCATWQYHLGAASLYRPDIQTVHVPVFTSGTFRRGLGERLTEAVIKRIEKVTPYKIVSAGIADSTLTGSVRQMSKGILAENANDVPRNIEVALQVSVTWTGRGGEPLMQTATMTLSGDSAFIPEAGQSISTAQQRAIERTAAQIVTQMELGL